MNILGGEQEDLIAVSMSDGIVQDVKTNLEFDPFGEDGE